MILWIFYHECGGEQGELHEELVRRMVCGLFLWHFVSSWPIDYHLRFHNNALWCVFTSFGKEKCFRYISMYSAHFEKLGIFLYNFWIKYLLFNELLTTCFYGNRILNLLEFFNQSNCFDKRNNKKIWISWNYRIRNSFLFSENIILIMTYFDQIVDPLDFTRNIDVLSKIVKTHHGG